MNTSILAQTDLLMEKTNQNIINFYFVAAHTNSGTRFYSDAFASFDQAENIFNSYIDVISYFDGGHVELYQINEDDYDILAHVKI